MQYLLFLLAFMAGSMFTIGLDKFGAAMRRARVRKDAHARDQLVRKLEAEGWQRPWLA